MARLERFITAASLLARLAAAPEPRHWGSTIPPPCRGSHILWEAREVRTSNSDLNTAKIMGQFGRGCGRIDAVLPGGRLLTDAWTRGYTVANAFHSDDCIRDA